MNDQKLNNSASILKNLLYSPPHPVTAKKLLALLRLPQIPKPLSYFSAFLVVLAAVIIQYNTLPEPATAPFIFFFPAIFLVSFYLGLRSAFLAVALSALAGNFIFIKPHLALSLSPGALLATLFFIIASIILVLFSYYFRKMFFNLDHALTRLEKVEKTASRANEYWNRTFDAISDLAFIQDKNFKIIRVNRAMTKAFKLRAKDIVGRRCYQVLHKSSKPWANCPFEKTRVDKKPHTEEVIDPEISRPLLVTTSPIFGKDGQFLGSVHIAKDISELKKIEQELRQSEERMSRSQEIAHLGGWELDLVNNKLIWSDEVYRIFGLKPQEFGATYEAFLEAAHPDDRQLVDAAYSGSLEQGKDSYEIEHRIVRKNSGEIRFVHEKCQHIRDKTGIIIRSVGMVHDITERKLMEERLRQEKVKVESLLSSIGDGVVAVDTAGKILFINYAFADLVKKAEADLLGQRLDEMTPLEDDRNYRLAPEASPIYLALTKGKRISLNIFPVTYHLRRNNDLIPLAVTAAPVTLDGQTIGAVAVYRDISREKAVDQAKTEFVSLASHQLRTPLASMALSTELLLRGVAGEINPEQKKYLREAYNSTKIMAELIKILLDISRIELGTFTVQLEPVNLAVTVNHLLEELDSQINRKKLILFKDYKINEIIQFDKNILRTAVENIITNAIRYTAEGGFINVSLEKKDKQILLKISDSGCGIPEKDKDKIFTKLFRSENAKLISADGAGLGLYLVKSLLKKVNCRVWFESELNKGTTFFVAIPVG